MNKKIKTIITILFYLILCFIIFEIGAYIGYNNGLIDCVKYSDILCNGVLT